jgi:hypothetical protein
MRVQTFVGKMSMEGLRQMDQTINRWLETHEVEPKFVSQCFGMDNHRETTSSEPVVITSIWY